MPRRSRSGAEGVEEEVVELGVHVRPEVDPVRKRILKGWAQGLKWLTIGSSRD